MILNIGSGSDYIPGAVNLDKNPNSNADVVRDLARGLPFDSERFNRVIARHVLEHIREDSDFAFVLNEVHRVLAPDGLFEVTVPPYTFEGAFSDPTHHRYFTPRTFQIIAGDNGDWDMPEGFTAGLWTLERLEERSSPKDDSAREYYVELRRK